MDQPSSMEKEAKPQAEDEQQVLSALTPPSSSLDPPEGDPEIESVLADFRDWLQTMTPGASDVFANGTAPPTIDLNTVLGHFVALRQEVNLQTRSVRAQQEQNAEVLQQLQQALEALRQKEARNEQLSQQNQEDRLRPLLKTLVDLYDSLSLAGREIQRAQAGMAPLLEPLAPEAGEEELLPEAGESGGSVARRFWSRWFLSPTADEAIRASQEETQQAVERLRQERLERRERLRQARESCQRVNQTLEALVTGYTMSLQRVDRALRQHGLLVIPTVGEPFDPDRMEVLEAVRDSGRPAGEVVEEVRRGYLWNGRVFRFAQVRVARG